MLQYSPIWKEKLLIFFKGSYYDYAIRDLSVFRKHYLDGHSLPQSASRVVMEYNHTSVNLHVYLLESNMFFLNHVKNAIGRKT
jgi:hypothetical protein